MTMRSEVPERFSECRLFLWRERDDEAEVRGSYYFCGGRDDAKCGVFLWRERRRQKCLLPTILYGVRFAMDRQSFTLTSLFDGQITLFCRWFCLFGVVADIIVLLLLKLLLIRSMINEYHSSSSLLVTSSCTLHLLSPGFWWLLSSGLWAR
jgi:hypothetical protein